MPLLEGKTDKDITKNIKTLLKEGYNKDKAIAIALSKAGKNENEESEISKFEVLLDSEEDKIETLKKVDINNVKLFSVGTWKGVKFTNEDLQDCVSAYNETKDRFIPILKLTHLEKNEHKKDSVLKNFPFRLGNVENLRVENNCLYGDYKNVVEPVAKMIKDKLITSHSAEFKENVIINGKKYKKWFYADALLGSQLPALAMVLEPYIKIENNKSGYDDVLFDISFENSLYYDMEFEGDNMEKTEYDNKIKKYESKGIKCMDFEDFNKMNDEKKSNYFEKMEKKLTYEDQSSELEFVKEELRKYKQEAEEKANKDAKLKYDAELQNQKNEIAELKLILAKTRLEKEQESNEKFVFSITKNPSGVVIPIALESKMIELLNNMDIESNSKIKFSDGDKFYEGTKKDNLKSFLLSLDNQLRSIGGIKKVFSTDEYLKVDKKITFSHEDLKFMEAREDDLSEDTIQSMSDHNCIRELMKKNDKLSYEDAYDVFYGIKSSF